MQELLPRQESSEATIFKKIPAFAGMTGGGGRVSRCRLWNDVEGWNDCVEGRNDGAPGSPMFTGLLRDFTFIARRYFQYSF